MDNRRSLDADLEVEIARNRRAMEAARADGYSIELVDLSDGRKVWHVPDDLVPQLGYMAAVVE